MSELLCPAGSFEIAKLALFNGADALYLACSNYGARAYAKNLSLEELDNLLNIAHSLRKKIYVTVNTVIKESELDDCLSYVKNLYELGVDGIICTDMAVVSFIVKECPQMEAHISTQSGLKDLNDVLFFEKYGAKRCVLARENSFEEIKYIKEHTKMPLEVFIHGALCVCYSGGCLMSSLLCLRSGNRGRCSQNCRREYKLKENGKIASNELCLLSMKDLNTFENVNRLKQINVDSLKIEGRMKNEAYVSLVTRSYRSKLDNPNFKTKALDKIYHRTYTNGFIFNESNGDISDTNKINNIGEYIGILKDQKNKSHLIINSKISKGDRLRFEDIESKYYSVDKIFDSKNQQITNFKNEVYLDIPFKITPNTKIYRMKDQALLDIEYDSRYKKEIDIYLYLESGKSIEATVYFDDQVKTFKSEKILNKASNKPLSVDTLKKLLEKLTDTAFTLGAFDATFKDDVFMPISGINELRREIVDGIYKFYRVKRIFKNIEINPFSVPFKNEKSLVAFCYTSEQYEACRELNIDAFYENYSPYVNSKYKEINGPVLVGNYGGLYHYNGQEITTDYSFNVTNSSAINELFRNGASNVTYSYELSMQEIKELALSYKNKFGDLPNCDLIIYGRINLMTLKYCPLKNLGKCPGCKSNTYSIVDNSGEFPLLHEGCITHILNGSPLNLIDELHLYYNYCNRFRLQFTNESKDECKKIIENALYKLNNLDEKTSFFNGKTDTRGYFKRPIQ